MVATRAPARHKRCISFPPSLLVARGGPCLATARQYASADRLQAGAARSPSAVVPKLGSLLFQLISDLGDAGLDAVLVLVAARRAAGAGSADNVVADLDRQRA